jgi:hypothetical protein
MAREWRWPEFQNFDLLVLQLWYLSSLAGTLLLGAPLVVLLKYRCRLTWRNVLLGSAVAGYVFEQLVVGAMLGELRADRLLDPHMFVGGTSLGLAGGIGFCVAAWPNNSCMDSSVNR